MTKRVVIARCPDYKWERLEKALGEALGPLGGLDRYGGPGKTVLLKPNLLRKARPEEAVTTHPALLLVIARMLVGSGARVIIADSPGAGIPHTRNALVKLYRACGLEMIARETGAELALDTAYRTVSLPGGKALKRIEIIEPFFRADTVINLPKFKTHAYTRLTGAVKNLFGLVPGLIKPGYHVLFRDLERFAALLVDVAEFARPALTIVDGIRGMEGPEGPGSGNPRQLGLLAAGGDPAAVDAALALIAGLPPESVCTVEETIRRGLIASDLSDIEFAGVPISEARQHNFDVPEKLTGEIIFSRMPAWLAPVIPVARRLLTSKPSVTKNACTRCGDCARACPAEAIEMGGKSAVIDYSRCISCFCCLEACPSKAIRSKSSFFRRILT